MYISSMLIVCICGMLYDENNNADDDDGADDDVNTMLSICAVCTNTLYPHEDDHHILNEIWIHLFVSFQLAQIDHKWWQFVCNSFE